MSKEEILEAIGSMTILELSELIDAIQEKFGVTPVAQAVAAPPGVGPVTEAPAVEEQTEFDVILQSAGEKKIQAIKVVRELTSLGLKEAKELVDKAPGTVLQGVSKEQAQKAREKLEEIGATVEVK